jgi:hypothetical protein
MTDRQKIEDLLVRYAIAIDTRDWELFRSCFVLGVDADYGDIGHWHGVEEITAFMQQVHTGPSQHRLSTMAIALDDTDPDRATARTYVDAIVLGPDGRNGANGIGHYDDVLTRDGDGWRIARRVYTGIRVALLGEEGLL